MEQYKWKYPKGERKTHLFEPLVSFYVVIFAHPGVLATDKPCVDHIVKN